MAPALVEHSAAQEQRNSSSQKYLEKLTCIPPIDIVLVDNLRHIDSSRILKNNLFSPTPASEKLAFTEKENHFSLKMMRNTTTAAMTPHHHTTTDILLSTKRNAAMDGLAATVKFISPKLGLSNKLETVKRESVIPIGNLSSASNSETFELRPVHPVAEYSRKKVLSAIRQKEEFAHTKFSNIQKSLSQIHNKVHNFRLRNVYGHLSCNLININDTSNMKTKKTDSSYTKDKNNHIFQYCQNISELPNVKNSFCESNFKLGPVHDSIKHMEDNDTDFEEDFGSRVKVPQSRGKRKNENPTPTPNVLRQWKEKRCNIGSQCSWLSLKIDALDKKITSIHRAHKKLKLERQANRKVNFDTTLTQPDSTVSTEQSSQLPHSLSTASVVSLDDGDHGSSRTCSLSGNWSHRYIRQLDIRLPSNKINCRNAPGVNSCNRCVTTVNKKLSTCKSLNIPAQLDASYHNKLSYKNEKSLAFLLEETLRKEKINTKVTITKPTKKKKKPRPKEILPVEKKISPANFKASRKNERRSDDYPRKRPSTESSTGRFRKIRKFSESYSCDSSKPSTPTNELISPLSQSLNSSNGLKYKKKLSSSGDYDIDNIVIPFSIASSTRVERIIYKEIPTPGWRNIDFEFEDRNRDENAELTDDETFLERHARCEIMERKRFSDFFQLSINRRRPRTSEGPNSEPPSPIFVDEPYKSNPDTPLDSPNPLNTAKSALNLQSYTEEERDPPWSLRKYPLTERDFKDLTVVEEAPSLDFLSEDAVTLASLKQVSQKLLSSRTPASSPLMSPSPVSSPSTPAEFNSNWTVKVVDEQTIDVVTSDKPRKGIVLKLAKK